MCTVIGCGDRGCAIVPEEGYDGPSKCTCTEAEIQHAILLDVGTEPGVVAWRNNSGTAKSEVVSRGHLMRLLGLIQNPSAAASNTALALIRELLETKPRFIHFGLTVGASDILGIVERRFVPLDLVGSRVLTVGVFLAIEVKTKRGAVTQEQQDFIDLVNRSGGAAGVARSVSDARAIVHRARCL